MVTVYIVTSGSYSDYSIERVFSTREKAEVWIGPGDSYYQVEEFALDDEGGERVILVYQARVDLETGESVPVLRSYPHVMPAGFRSTATIERRRDVKRSAAIGSDIIEDKFADADSSVSSEHALKVAIEKRQEWLRTRDLAKAAPDA